MPIHTGLISLYCHMAAVFGEIWEAICGWNLFFTNCGQGCCEMATLAFKMSDREGQEHQTLVILKHSYKTSVT